MPSPSAITYQGYRDSCLHLSARKTSPGEKHRRLMLLPHSDVSPELEPKVTRQVSVPTLFMLFFVDRPISDSENRCLVLSRASGRSALQILQNSLRRFTYILPTHFLAQKRGLSLLPKNIGLPNSSGFSPNSWLGEFC